MCIYTYYSVKSCHGVSVEKADVVNKKNSLIPDVGWTKDTPRDDSVYSNPNDRAY